MNNTIYGGTTATPTPLATADQTYDRTSTNAQSGIAVAEALNYKLILETEITQEAVENAGDNGIKVITLGAEDFDMSPYNEISIRVDVPDSSEINTSSDMINVYATWGRSLVKAQYNYFCIPQSNSIATNSMITNFGCRFTVNTFWQGEEFLYGELIRNGYKLTNAYPGDTTGWNVISKNFEKKKRNYFHIIGRNSTFKFPVGTTVKVYGR